MLYLATSAKDPEMKQRGRMMIDWILAELAANSLNGILRGPNSRTDEGSVIERWIGPSCGRCGGTRCCSGTARRRRSIGTLRQKLDGRCETGGRGEHDRKGDLHAVTLGPGGDSYKMARVMAPNCGPAWHT